MKTILITFGNAYRAGVKEEETARYLGRELGWRLGLEVGAAGGMATGLYCGWAAIACSPVGGLLGGITGFTYGLALGDDIALESMDPRSEFGAYALTSSMYNFPALFGAP